MLSEVLLLLTQVAIRFTALGIINSAVRKNRSFKYLICTSLWCEVKYMTGTYCVLMHFSQLGVCTVIDSLSFTCDILSHMFPVDR